MTATRVLWIFVFLISTCALRAQSFSVSDIDASQFPIMKAKFFAVDSFYIQHRPTASEIAVTENGIFRNVISVSCPPEPPVKASSSALVVDVSGSMGGEYLNIAKQVATALVNRLAPGIEECAVSSFNDHNYLNQDFTTNKGKLLAAIASLNTSGGTDFDKGLLLPVAGGLEVTKQGRYRKAIIFITDGCGNTNQVNEIIREAQRQNCSIFTIAVALPCPQSLIEISSKTGGKWFENIETSAQITDVCAQILIDKKGGLPCEIVWESAVSCSEAAERSVVADWNGVIDQSTYSIPGHGLAQLELSTSSLRIDSKPPGVTFDTTITVIAKGSAFTITNITSSHPAFDVNPKSLTLAAGESQILTVSYTPPGESYTWTKITVESAPCGQSYYVSAFSRSEGESANTIRLDHPNGGEQFLAGSDTVITWSGISPADTVRLEYSLDGGNTWNIINEFATGGFYNWQVPNTESPTCLVRVTQQNAVGSTNGGGWAKRIEGRWDSQSFGVAADQLGNVYSTGYFMGNVNVDGIGLQSSSTTKKMFLVKYDPSGNVVWARQSTVGDAQGRGIAVDRNGKIYVIGSFIGLADFSGQTVNTFSSTREDMFIARYASDGSIEWVKQFGSSSAIGYGVTTDLLGDIYVTGTYLGNILFGSTVLTNYSSTSANEGFIARLRSDGTAVWAKRIVGEKEERSSAVSVDPEGNVYVGGYFNSTTVDLDGISLTNASPGSFKRADIFLAKYLSDGTIEWARSAGDNAEQYGYGVAADKYGSIYVVGQFLGSPLFDGKQITSVGGYDVFIAKYLFDGTCEWIKRAGGKGLDRCWAVTVGKDGTPYIGGDLGPSTVTDKIDFDSVILAGTSWTGFAASYTYNGNLQWLNHVNASSDGLGIAIDSVGNNFVSGSFFMDGDFGTITYTNPELSDAFIRKIAKSNILQSDASDAMFAIVKLVLTSHDIDMGDVLVGESEDSLVKSFVSNTGSYPFRVDSVAVLGSTEFHLVAGLAPFTIPANGAYWAEFRFQPTSPGPKSAQVMIITQADTLYQTITGNGIQPTISTIGTVIDFGSVETMTTKDTTITVAIRNIGTVPVDFTGDAQLGPDKSQFILLSGGGAFTLQPNESREVSIRFAPRFIGRTSGRIGFDYNGPGSPAILQLFGQGLGGLVKIADDSAYPGENRNIALTLVNTPTSTLQSVATGFRARVAYNSTVLAPFGGNVVRGSGVDTVAVEGALNTDNSLTSMPFLAALGNADVSSMDLVEFVWLDAQGQPANYDVETESGTFKLLGVCEEGGKRLFNPNGQVAITRISPNPASESMQVDIETIEVGRTQVVVMDVLGRTIATLYDGEIASGVHNLTLNTSKIAAGSYYVSLVTPTVKRFARVDVAR